MEIAKKESTVVEELAQDIASLYSNAQAENSPELNERQLLSCWLIGQSIVDVEKTSAIGSYYGAKLISALADELSSQGLRGLSARSLRDMRRFYNEVARDEMIFDLSWSHYRILLSVQDRSERERIARQAIRDRLSKSGLERLVRSRRLQGGFVLARPDGAFRRYEVEDKKAFFVSGAGLLLNLGFRVLRSVEGADRRRFKPGDVVEARASGGKVVLSKPEPAESKCSYVYPARVLRVVDGDTIAAAIDLGLGALIEMRLRLRGVDTADVRTAEGEKAKRFVARRLRQGDVVAIRTYKHDPYDRYVADIIYATDKQRDPERIFATGRFLNEELLQKGIASHYAG